MQSSEDLNMKDSFLRVGQHEPGELLEYETGTLPLHHLLILETRILVVGEICNTPSASNSNQFYCCQVTVVKHG